MKKNRLYNGRLIAKRIIAGVIFCVILFALLTITNYVCIRKYSYNKYYDFYNQKEDFDVLFFGTSHVINGILPQELWNDYGVVSYNMANHSETIATNYWQLVYALNHTKPKVVVVDLYAIDSDMKSNTKYLHNLTDSIPLSITKIKMITDILEKEYWTEYLLPLSLYHARWDDDFSVNEIKIYNNRNVQKGAELRTDVERNEPPMIVPKAEYDPTERIAKQYLQKIVDLCKKNGIEVVLTYLPYSAPESHFYPANWGYDFAQKNNIPYLNMLYEDVINYSTDCADAGSHLNVSGAKKVTHFIGEYLKENYQLEDHSEDENYAHWDKDFDEYMNYKEKVLKEQNEAFSFLAAAYDPNFEYNITWTKNSMLKNDFMIMEYINSFKDISTVHFEETEPPMMHDQVLSLEVVNKRTGQPIKDVLIMYYEGAYYIEQLSGE